jgi:hypothetical protein
MPITVNVTVRPRPPGAGTATGTVALFDVHGTPLGEALPLDADGRARTTIVARAGLNEIRAQYGGDSRFEASSGASTHTARRATTVTTLTSAPNPVPAGHLLELLADVAIEPGPELAPYGTLQFTVDGSAVGPPIALMGASGVVVTVLAPDMPTAATVGVTYSGDADTESSSASLRQVVAGPPAAPSAAAPASVAPPVAVTRVVTRTQLTRMVADLIVALKRRGLPGLASARQTLTAPGPGVLQQTVTATGRRGKAVALASGRQRFGAAGRATLRLRLTSQGRRLARRGGRRPLTIVTRFVPPGGPSITATRQFVAR